MTKNDDAVDFLDAALIERLLKGPAPDASAVREAIAKGLSLKALSLEETALLLRADDPALVEAFAQLLEQEREGQSGEKRVAAGQLQPGMVLARDFLADNGALLLAADILLTPAMVGQIRSLAVRRGEPLWLQVRVEKQE